MAAVRVRGKIYTGAWDKTQTVEALWVEDGVVRALGEEALAMTSPTRDLFLDPGAALVPGFWDAHIHLLEYGLSLEHVHLEGLHTVQAVANEVAAALAQTAGSDNEPVVGHGWSASGWLGSPPHRRFLHALTNRRPILLWNHDHHSLWVNDVALRQVGVGQATAAPAGGVIERDPDGTPTGILRDAAVDIIMSRLGTALAPSSDVAERAILRAQESLLRHGVTAVCTMGEPPEGVRALCALAREGKLRLRVAVYLPIERLAECESIGLAIGLGSDRLWLGGLKGFMDGSLGSQTALMKEPYTTGGLGIATALVPTLPAVIARARRAGLRLALHAIGDEAVTKALIALQAGEPAVGLDRVEHAQLVTGPERTHWPAAKVAASVQPIHLTDDLDLLGQFWGERRANLSFPFATLRKQGVSLLFGSDAPVSDPNPLMGLRAAVTRSREGGKALCPKERLTAAEALRAYGPATAAAEGRPHLGRLTPQSPATFAILTADPLDPHVDFETLRVHSTWVDGIQIAP